MSAQIPGNPLRVTSVNADDFVMFAHVEGIGRLVGPAPRYILTVYRDGMLPSVRRCTGPDTAVKLHKVSIAVAMRVAGLVGAFLAKHADQVVGDRWRIGAD